MRVAVVGDNTIDRCRGVESADYLGGNALNVAVQLRLAGIEVTYFGAVADDPDGRLVRRALDDVGVDTSGLAVLPGRTAVTAVRITDDGDRVFEQEDYGVSGNYRPRAADIARIAGFDWIHVGMLPDAAQLRREVRRSQSGARISQDCSVSAGYRGLDVAFCSAQDGEPDGLATAALSGGARLAVVTRGALGAVATDGRRCWSQPAAPTSLVDTIGAGDSFIAGFIGVFAGSGDAAAAMAEGARRAAVTCAHAAGWPQTGRPH